MKRSVSFGSWPSKPTTISRRIFGFGRWALRRKRTAALNGHNRSENNAISPVTKKTKKDVTNTNPAPGPTYAASGAGEAARRMSPSVPATSAAKRRLPVLFFRP